MNCSICGSPVMPSAKFCTACGAVAAAAPKAGGEFSTSDKNTSLTALPALPAKADTTIVGGAVLDAPPRPLEVVGEYLVWNLHPGEVARMLPPKPIGTYAGARGVAIHDGTRALVFINGAVEADLQNGLFDFSQNEAVADASTQRGTFMSFVVAGTSLAAKFLRGGGAEAAQTSSPDARNEAKRVPAQQKGSGVATADGEPKTQLISALLVRQGPLPVILTVTKAATLSVVSDVIVQFMVEIADPIAFHRALMLVRRELGLNALAVAVAPIVESSLRKELAKVTAEEIGTDPVLDKRLAEAMAGALTADWGFLRVVRVVKVSTQRGEIDRLRRFRDTTYFSDRALEQITARNEFANRLHLERNSLRIQQAVNAHKLHSALEEINRDDLLSQDDLAKFELLLDHGRRIREATSEEEYQEALAGLRKSELVREDSLELIKRESEESRQDHAQQRVHALALFDLSRQLETDQARLQWEYEIGDKRIALEMERRLRDYVSRHELATLAQREQRMRDEYADERQHKEDLRSDSRRQTHDVLEREERLGQLKIAKEAQALTEDRLNHEHERELASATQRAKDEREAGLVEAQRWAGMSVEQIMAANPALTSAGATALAAKYQAEANALAEKLRIEAAGNDGHQLLRQAEANRTELRDLMERQLANSQELMRQSLEANARIAGAMAGGAQTAGATTAVRSAAAAGNDLHQFCSRCGQRLTTAKCPTCGPE